MNTGKVFHFDDMELKYTVCSHLSKKMEKQIFDQENGVEACLGCVCPKLITETDKTLGGGRLAGRWLLLASVASSLWFH